MTTTKTALILGVTGQDGSYLAELLLSKGYRVHGVHRRTSLPNTHRIAHLLTAPKAGGLQLHHGDLSDGASIDRVIHKVTPDEIYNMADQDDVRWSYDTPGYSMDVTAGAVGRLLESVGESGLNPRVFQPVSATMFGMAPPPQHEGTPLDPLSPYACAKAHAYHLCRFYRQVHGLHVSTGIMFNHDSPRRGPGYLLQKICHFAVRCSRGQQDHIALGDLDLRVDIGYAGDYVQAAWLMLRQDQPDDYVIGRGTSWTIREILGMALRSVGVYGEPGDLVVADPAYKDNGAPPVLIANPARAEEVLRWKASTGMMELLGMIIDHYLVEG